jgi:DNA helicase-2/ATP-dependent DNA helicase PcrA
MRYSQPSRFLKESRLKSEEKEIKIDRNTTSKHMLNTGDQIMHQVFGRGVVIRIDSDIATIAFDFPHGIKKILESHPSIRKVKKEN